MSLDIESRKRGREDQEDGGDKRQRRPQPELRLALEQEKVSHVIGKGGAVIKNIIKQSGAYIKFAPVKEGTTRQVGHISGNADCIGLAIELLTYQLAKYQTPEAKTLPALTLLVATPQIGLIIGKAGQIVRSVQSQSGARVQISPRPDATADGSPIDQDVAIFGSSQSVAAAARILISYLFRQTVTPQAAYPVAATPFGLAATPYWPAAAATAISTAPPLGSDELEVRFALNPGEVSRIIGKGGSGIQSITKSSRVKLVFDKSVQPAIGGAASGRVQIGTVRGEGANIIKSLEMVIQTISAKPDRDSAVAEVSDEKRAGPLRFLLMIPSPVIGFLLGTKGAKIKETKEKSGASINITGRGDAIWDHVTGVALQAVVVEGDADQVTTAIRLVVQQLDESRQAPRRRGGSSSEAEVV